MKKLLLLTLFPMLTQSQDVVSTSEGGLSVSGMIDGWNALTGGTVDDSPKLDYVVELFYRSNNIELGIEVERYPRLDYVSEGIFIRYIEDIGIQNKWEIVPGISYSTISREFGDFNSWAVQGSVRYKIKRFKIVVKSEFRDRRDRGWYKWSTHIGAQFIIFRD